MDSVPTSQRTECASIGKTGGCTLWHGSSYLSKEHTQHKLTQYGQNAAFWTLDMLATLN